MHASRLLCLLWCLAAAGCPDWDAYTGTYCSSRGVVSGDCHGRLIDARCADGGLTSRGMPDGGALGCCSWQQCRFDPYPDEDEEP